MTVSGLGLHLDVFPKFTAHRNHLEKLRLAGDRYCRIGGRLVEAGAMQ